LKVKSQRSPAPSILFELDLVDPPRFPLAVRRTFGSPGPGSSFSGAEVLHPAVHLRLVEKHTRLDGLEIRQTARARLRRAPAPPAVFDTAFVGPIAVLGLKYLGNADASTVWVYWRLMERPS
jgi:hypothetical protein